MAIKSGELVVIGKMWKSRDAVIKWPLILRWHPECWIEQGRIEAMKKPILKRVRTHKYTGEQRLMRIAVLRRRAAVVQRIRREMSKDAELRNISRLVHLGGMLERCTEEIAALGGVPKSWQS